MSATNTANHNLLDFERAVTATTVADAQISPDGTQVAYVTTSASKPGEEPPTSTLWLVDAAGGPSRRLTLGDAGDNAPRWSPDGARLAFISDRKERGKPQVYVLSLAGGEAIRLTEQKGGVGPAEWSPDGKRLAYTATEAPSEEEEQRKKEHDEEVIDADIKRGVLWVVDVPADLASVAPDALPQSRRLSPEGAHIGGFGGGGFAWAPDSAGLIASATEAPKAHYFLAPEILVMPLKGEVTRLGRVEGLSSTPRYNADGTTLAFIAAETVIPAQNVVQTMPAGGGERRTLLQGADASFHDVHWLPDGDRLIGLADEGQQGRMLVVDPETNAATDAVAPFPNPGTFGSWSGMPLSLSRDGRRVAFAFADDASFGDVYVAELGGKATRLTDLNPWTRDYQFGETREVSWTSTDGLEIQGLLILPVGYQEGQRYPMLLQIHGGPAGAWTHHLYANWHDWAQFLAQRGYAVLMPNPRGSTGRGTDFLCGIVECYGEPDFQDLMTGVDYVIEQGIADPDKLVVGGWSGGGFLTNWTVTHTDRFKAALSGAGIANWVSFQGTADVRSIFDRYFGKIEEDPATAWRLSPVRSIGAATTPTLIVYGAEDFRVPPSQGHEMYEGLKSRGVETQLVIYPREPHIFAERKHQLDLLNRMVAWFDGHLGR